MIDLGRKLTQWEHDPDRARVDGPDGPVTNARFADCVRTRANELEALDVGPGSVVAVTAGRGPGFLTDLVAVWMCDAVAVPVSREHYDHMEEKVRPTLILNESIREGGSPRRDPRLPEHTGAILLTGGSLDEPRWVVLSQRALLGNADATVAVLSIRADDRLLVNTPFHTPDFVCHLLATMVSDATLIALEEPCSQPELVGAVKHYEATAFGGAPIQLRRLADGIEPNCSLRWWMSSGEHLPAQFVGRVTARHPETSLHVFYGLTEAGGRFCSMPASRNANLAGSVGVPIRGMSVSVRDEKGRVLPRGVPGHIYARGHYLMTGYLEDASLQRVGREGFATGDLGHQDEDGNLWLVGRADDVFKVGGQKVSGDKITQALMDTGLFADAAVVPVDDESLGTVAGACVVSTDAALERKSVVNALESRLPPLAVPRRFYRLDAIPRTVRGELKKAALHSLLKKARSL